MKFVDQPLRPSRRPLGGVWELVAQKQVQPAEPGHQEDPIAYLYRETIRQGGAVWDQPGLAYLAPPAGAAFDRLRSSARSNNKLFMQALREAADRGYGNRPYRLADWPTMARLFSPRSSGLSATSLLASIFLPAGNLALTDTGLLALDGRAVTPFGSAWQALWDWAWGRGSFANSSPPSNLGLAMQNYIAAAAKLAGFSNAAIEELLLKWSMSAEEYAAQTNAAAHQAQAQALENNVVLQVDKKVRETADFTNEFFQRFLEALKRAGIVISVGAAFIIFLSLRRR